MKLKLEVSACSFGLSVDVDVETVCFFTHWMAFLRTTVNLQFCLVGWVINFLDTIIPPGKEDIGGSMRAHFTATNEGLDSQPSQVAVMWPSSQH